MPKVLFAFLSACPLNWRAQPCIGQPSHRQRLDVQQLVARVARDIAWSQRGSHSRNHDHAEVDRAPLRHAR
eukprot:8496588-Pyramimonas_sp.AAC.1